MRATVFNIKFIDKIHIKLDTYLFKIKRGISMSKKDLVKKVQDKLASNIQDAKDIEKRITPLVEEYKNKKSNPEEIAKLIELLSEQVTIENSSEELRRGILFTFRDKGFFESSETQQQWHDLAESWEVSKYFLHLINKSTLHPS